MPRVAYVDAPAGCAGDMFLGALLDLGLSVAVIEDVIDRLGLDDVTLQVARVTRGALAATQVQVCRRGKPIAGKDDVHVDPGHHEHGRHAHHGRSLAEVLRVLGHAGDAEVGALAQAAAAYRHLAEAEARVHGTTPEAIHFHEVGAADALVDVAGTCVGLAHLGVEQVYVSALPWGRGTVDTRHGLLPNPAPATAVLLEGHPTVPSEETYEQVTPTGAALVRALAVGHRPPPGFVPRATGLGAGTRDGSTLPNVLRIVLGDLEDARGSEEVVLLETNLDDATGQVVGHALELLLEAGALDAWFAPITMKKGRPGVLLSVLCTAQDVGAMEAVLFRETPTLGVRRRVLSRSVLARRTDSVATPWGTVRMKVRVAPGGEAATPEYEDARSLARRHGVALCDVLAAAQSAWAQGGRSR